MSKEVWKLIIGYEQLYEVSSLGRIKSLSKQRKLPTGELYVTKEKIINFHVDIKRGYCQLELSNGIKGVNRKIHRLVALSFIENPNNYPQVNHIDGNKNNNCVENLEWCNNSMNQIHAYKLGLRNSKQGEDHHNSKLTNKERQEIIEDYNNGIGSTKLSWKYKVNKVTIHRIINKSKNENNTCQL